MRSTQSNKQQIQRKQKRQPQRHLPVVMDMSFVASILLILLLNSSSKSIVFAFSTGAGTCESSSTSNPNAGAAVRDFHLDKQDGKRKVKTGSIEDHDHSVVLNKEYVLQPVPIRSVLNTNAIYDITVRSNDGSAKIKGCFIRLQAQPTDSGAGATSQDDGTFLLTADQLTTQMSNTCAGIEPLAMGVTHFNAELKSSCSGTIVLLKNLPVAIDITIVLENDNKTSVYAYSPYEIRSDATLPPGISDAPKFSAHKTSAPTDNTDDAIQTVAPSDQASDMVSDFVSTSPTMTPSDRSSDVASDTPSAPSPTERPPPPTSSIEADNDYDIPKSGGAIAITSLDRIIIATTAAVVTALSFM